MSEDIYIQPKTLSWFARFFRKKVRLTYWLGETQHQAEICWFHEKTPYVIMYKDYYTKNLTLVKWNRQITYKLQQIK